jgi:2-succinyl-5-enolpyruvyl-6-hydroxy-3-cyclohexene-1-carboxylate synthase
LLFGTPPSSDVGNVARGFGLEVHEVTAAPELDDALAACGSARSPALLRVKLRGRAENVALHEAINQAVRLALA